MIIKKFTAKTENEAIANAKKELGDGVVVMNVKDVKAKGFFAFLKPHTVEVTVALEEESEKYTAAVSAINNVIASSQPQETPAATAAPGIAAPPVTEDKTRKENSAIEEKLDSLQSLLEQQLQKPEEEKDEKEKKEKEEDEEKRFGGQIEIKME